MVIYSYLISIKIDKTLEELTSIGVSETKPRDPYLKLLLSRGKRQ